jgi:2-polyprenyl-3-methyl-5-hydroxy-6-metoxy-1,4-benzoquinol methylase
MWRSTRCFILSTLNPHLLIRARCPVCDSADPRELFRSSFTDGPILDYLKHQKWAVGRDLDFSVLTGGEYVLKECLNCRLLFQEQIPDEHLGEIISEQWISPEFSLHRKERNSTPARGRVALEVMSIIDFLGKDPRELRMLDFGMGWGAWVRISEAFGCETYGVERSHSRVEHATEHHLKVLSLDEAETMSFDFINSDQVFEHLDEPYEVARRLVGALRPDGILKISVPIGVRARRLLTIGNWAATQGERHSMHDVGPLDHINCFLHESLVALGQRAGLEPVPIPARLRYRYAPVWERPGRLIRRTVGQHYRALRKQNTGVWFRRTPGP